MAAADADWCLDVCVEDHAKRDGDVSWNTKRERRDVEGLEVKQRSFASTVVPRERFFLGVNLALKTNHMSAMARNVTARVQKDDAFLAYIPT